MMKKFNNYIFTCIILLLLSSCGTVREGFQNPKKNSSDEFLVEKKSPLVMPPEFEKLPFPKNEEKGIVINKSNLKELISDNTKDDVISNDNLEESILDQIKKTN